ncbi:MAG: nuclear transport factor 2 family protein [Candidatus Acidiferrales bacterium]
MKVFNVLRVSLFVSLGIAAFSATSARLVSAQERSVKQADEDFVHAARSGQTAALGALLDRDFTWTDGDGRTLDKAEVLKSLPTLADATGTTERTYGSVVTFLSSQGKTHVLRIWVKRPDGWRLLVYHQVTQRSEPPPPGGTGMTDCENPCKAVPIKPKNSDEQAVIASWQALETGVTAHNAAAWSPHISDDFIQVSSNNDHPLDKAGRMAILDRQKQSGVGSAPAPLVSATMYDFGDTIVMTCLHQPYHGKPVRVSRVWIKRDDKWTMSISFQTAVQAAEAKSS